MLNFFIMLNKELLFLSKSRSILLQRDFSKTNIEIIFYYFCIFDSRHILNAFDKHVYVAKIRVFLNIFDNESNNCCFSIVVKIEEVNFRRISLVSFLIVNASIINRVDKVKRILRFCRIKNNISCFYKSLKSILLLLRKIDFFSIEYSDR